MTPENDWTSWYRACGADADGGSPALGCALCRVPFETPDPGPPRVGLVVAFAGQPGDTCAVAESEQDGTVQLGTTGAQLTPAPVTLFDTLPRLTGLDTARRAATRLVNPAA